MREISADKIKEAVKKLCIEVNYELGEDVLEALKKALDEESSSRGKSIIAKLIENAEIARRERLPICQDTGFVKVFLEIGEDVKIKGGDLYESINRGVREGYEEGYLRKSIVSSPIFDGRKNTGDNTPAIVDVEIVSGENLSILVALKGGGSENAGGIALLKPADGLDGVKKFVVEHVASVASDACPPVIVGVGIGGTIDQMTLLAKKASLRKIGEQNPDPQIAELEEELLKEVNALGIGSQGLGGDVTALAVNVETYPCHIATLPVAVDISCHALRRKKVVL